MSLDFSIEDFKQFYCDKLLSKEEMIRQLNITDYTYKKIIKEFNLNRCKTNKMNRFKANNGININNIEVVKILDNPEIPKIHNKIINSKKTEKDNNDLLDKVKETLAKSKTNRNNRK